MKALTLNHDLTLSLTERPKPELGAPDDVIVRVVQSGICGTDRSVLVGKFPAEAGVIMGHEAVGVIDAAGSAVTAFAEGDRVIVNPTLYCGNCAMCFEGVWNFCENKTGFEVGLDFDGSFAEFIRIPAKFCHLIPERMDFDRAVLVEPLACSLNNLEAAQVSNDDVVLILGGGPMGAVTAMGAQSYGARVFLVEPDDARFAMNSEIFGHEAFAGRVTVHRPDEAQLRNAASVVIDCVGSLLEQSLDYAAVRARIVVMGFNSNAEATLRPLQILQRGLQIIGAGDYNSKIFPKAIRLAGELPLELLITHRFGLAQHADAFRALAALPGAEYAALKVVLAPEPVAVPV